MTTPYRLVGTTVQASYTTINSSTGFGLIDLSDTIKYDHDGTGHIVVDLLDVNIDPTTSFTGDFYYGFITGASAASSTLNVVKHIPMNQQNRTVDRMFNYFPASLQCRAGRHFGQLKQSRTEFKTDTAIKGPNGQSDFMPADGDFVSLVIVGAGTADVAQTIVYHTEPS